jgi:hypothetical protein
MDERRRWRDVLGVLWQAYADVWLKERDAWGYKKSAGDYLVEGCLFPIIVGLVGLMVVLLIGMAVTG